jgi:predicted nucleic acid-binding protein|tara:strand:+ start:1338 stop:1574 length:237 start_codon:yes stop_codon:yes gene_type:complete
MSLMSSSDTLEQQINRNVDTIKSQLEGILGIIKDNKDKTLSEKELQILKNIQSKIQILKKQITDVLNIKTNTKQETLF